MRAMVTGAAGFVGRHMVARLQADGWKVHTCDTVTGTDCRDEFAWNRIRYDLVVHCAAIVGGRVKIEGAPMSVAENLSIDSAMFQWALRTRPAHVLYWSSSAAYPVHLQAAPGHRLTEDDIDLASALQPDNTYGWAKLTGEIQADLVRAEGVPVTVIRPFSGWGADQDPSYPMRAFLDRAVRREDPFTIWGDGQQVRDWVHVSDVISAALAAVEANIPVLNACTGRPTSFDHLAALVTDAADYDPEPLHLSDAPTGVRYRVGDPTLMRSIWEPKVTLEEGIDRALRARMAA